MNFDVTKKSFVWYCGFNVFQQSEILQVSKAPDSGNGVDNAKKCATSENICNESTKFGDFAISKINFPEGNVKNCVITWSRIIFKTDTGDIYLGGHSVDKCVCENVDCITACGEDIILLHKTGVLSILKDEKDCNLKTFSSDVALKTVTDLNGTVKQCYILHDSGVVGCIDILSQADADIIINKEDTDLVSRQMETNKLLSQNRTDVHPNQTAGICILASQTGTSIIPRQADPDILSQSGIRYLTFGVSVTQLSCGKEHVLVLDSEGTVYSFGGGSRGQLGHETVDNKEEPTVIATLIGLKMCLVAAGGWHSASVSEDGDIYVWGWNESGQLGLPCQTSYSKDKLLSSEMSVLTETESKHTDSTKATSIFEDPKFSKLSHFGVSDKFDVDFSVCHTAAVNENLTQVGDIENDTMGKTRENVTENKKVHPPSGPHEVNILDNVCQHQSQILESSSEGQLNVSDSKIFIQDIEAVQVQTVPHVLDLVEEFTIKKVSCGSRHTAVLTESGTLLTCGWNSYGQLCHGDTKSRDFLQMAEFFIKNKFYVADVFCGQWSTVVVPG